MGNISASKAVQDLIRRFDRDRAVFQSGDYKEEQLRAEFLNPLFEALGWDVANKAGLSETYKPVIHEESIKVAGATKAPDYTFRIGGRRVFFVEAKKPSVSVAEDIGPAFQLRRYAWTAKLPVSILSDFEEFAVYDCRIRPVKTDKASVARTMLLSFKDYLTRWDELVGLFSPDAIQKGALERYVESTRTKKGTAAVDDTFLEEISGWREMLAKSIALRNPRLSTRELNFSVQRTIDRLIFLRICEDRGIENYAYLQSLLNGTNIYARLKKHFYDADDRYNSGLFHFAEEKGRAESPDRLTLDLQIDDKPLKDIIAGLYYPDSPYEFSVMPAEVLGQVYEQFLGKVIRLTAGHQAKVEDKPEVRKAGGVYYTPAYIVDYIVKNTVGKLVEGKTPAEVSKLHILDPACGSGSFLLGAYQHLLDWHLDYYQKKRGQGSGIRGQGQTYQDANGNLRLTTAERKRILLNDIFGVDIDSQAVEVTKLSLLLKVLEGENQETLGSQLKLYHERALPDLGSNIKCGNSLIGPDFYQGEQQTMFENEEERLRINVFDWNAAFPDIMKSGGFDAVIGNPPYYKVSGQTDPVGMAYFKERYACAQFKTELYALFIERSLQVLADGGVHSFIVPNSFLAGVYLRPLRALLAKDNSLGELVLLKDIPVFQDAKLDSVVYVVQKAKPTGQSRFVLRLADGTMGSKTEHVHAIRVSDWQRTGGLEFRVTGGAFPSALAERLRKTSRQLSEFATVHLGLVLESNDLLADRRSTSSPDAILLGRDIGRYDHAKPCHWFAYGRDPIVGGTKNPAVYEAGPRILVQAIRNLKLPRRLVGTLVPKGTYTMGTLHNIIIRTGGMSALYFLGLLNSRLLNQFYAASYPEHRIKGAYLGELPVRRIDFTNKADKARHDKTVKLVERMLDLHKQLPKAKTPHERESIERTIVATDKAIDQLVYELYGLTENEIRIVEASAKT